MRRVLLTRDKDRGRVYDWKRWRKDLGWEKVERGIMIGEGGKRVYDRSGCLVFGSVFDAPATH